MKENKVGMDASDKCDDLDRQFSQACLRNKGGDITPIVSLIKNTPNKWKYAAHASIKNNRFDVAHSLLQDGSEAANEPNAEGQTPLQLAVLSHHAERRDFIKWLVTDMKVGVNLKDKSVKSALDVAISTKDDETVKILVMELAADRCDGLTLKAATLNGCSTLRYLLDDCKQDINIQNSEGQTLLHLAVQCGRVESVNLLLERCSALINVEDSSNIYPIHEAAIIGNVDIIRLLCEKGADINVTSPNGSPLCLACQHGHEQLVEYLLQKENIDPNICNQNSDNALHLATRSSHLRIALRLIEEDHCNVTATNQQDRNVFHLIAMFGKTKGWINLAEKANGRGLNIMAVDITGKTALHLAIANGNETLSHYLVNVVLDKEGIDGLIDSVCVKDRLHSTPFRSLIQKMPTLAKEILDKCIQESKDENEATALCFKLKVLDDTFTEFDDNGHTVHNAKPYSNNYTHMKDRHPLKLIATNKCHELLKHPVTKLVLRRKWAVASFMYFFFIFFYASLVILVSVYMIQADPPFQVNQTWCQLNLLDDVVLNLWNEEGQGNMQTGLTAAVGSLAVIGIVLEILQLGMTFKDRLRDIHNYLDWFTYITAIILIIDFTECKTRATWQWQLGVACIFVSWLNLLFYLRKTPKLGIYVVMIGMICATFLQFFIVFFLFILAFAISFYLLLQNQHAFENIWYSLIKTWVMMIGEMDFTDIFHGYHDDESHEVQLYFKETTYAVFVVFLILVSLIIMNLLTGLAVSDVNKLLEDSSYQMSVMQIQLALDIEFSFPCWILRKLVKNREIIGEDNRRGNSVRRALSHFYYGPLSIDIVKAEGNTILNSQKEDNTHLKGYQPESDLSYAVEQITVMLNAISQKVDTLEQRLAK